MKWMTCENSKPDSKYFNGRVCYEEVAVDENCVRVLCWKCTAMMVPPDPVKVKTGYPRGWKFMAEFVDKEGNVFHKGVVQPKLFGKLPPTPEKIAKKREKKKDTMEELVLAEVSKRMEKKKSKGKTKVKTNTQTSVDKGKSSRWFDDSSTVSIPETKVSPAKSKPTKKKPTVSKPAKKVTKTTTKKPTKKVATKKVVKKVAKKVAKKVVKKKVK